MAALCWALSSEWPKFGKFPQHVSDAAILLFSINADNVPHLQNDLWNVYVGQPYRVRGCILTLVERMDEEFTKIMQNTDPHSQGEN